LPPVVRPFSCCARGQLPPSAPGRYATDVVKRSIGLYIRTDRRPTDRPTTDDLTFAKISNGHTSARGRPIHGGVFEVGGSNGANSGLTKFNRYMGENNARGEGLIYMSLIREMQNVQTEKKDATIT